MSGLDYAARAAAGAAFLDEQMPGWAERIDLAELDMGSCTRCILGQLLGDYACAVEDLGLRGDAKLVLGFNAWHGGSGPWDKLRTAWADEVGKRREPAQATR